MSPREILLDVSDLEAPLPLSLALKNAAKLEVSEYIKMTHRMRPCKLFDFLQKMDVWWYDFAYSDEQYLVFIAKLSDTETIEHIKEKVADEYGRTIA